MDLLDTDARAIRRFTLTIGAAIVFAGAAFIFIVAYAGWNSNSVEASAETARVWNALNQGISRALDQEKSVAWWDDAVDNIENAFDVEFADSNFGVFLTETYGHDEVYILDGSGKPVYAFLNGARAAPGDFYRHEPDLRPVILGVTQNSSGGLRDRPDVFGANQQHYDLLKGALTASRWKGNLLIVDGKPAIVTAITIVPNVDLSKLTGKPYLLVSVIDLDADYISSIGVSLLLNDIQLVDRPQPDLTDAALTTDDGRIAGYLQWTSMRPGEVLLRVILPLVCVGVIATGLLSFFMLRRLTKASAELASREAKATYEAKHDALSRLPNRTYFAARTARELERRGERGEPASILIGYLDIDRFKDINDTLGHHTGDELIKRVGERLRSIVGPNDFLARFGGDEFAIIHPLSADPAGLQLRDAVADAFRQPFSVAGQEIRVTASFGLAQSPDHGVTTEELLQNADIALYEAKRRGRDQTVAFSNDMAGELQYRRAIEVELRDALHANRLELYYQPIVSCQTNRIIGAEALLRWNHPDKGSIPPSLFIPIAEESGLMPELGEWVLRNAVRTASGWAGLNVAINLSPAQFRHVDLEGLLREVLATSSIEASQITLEITEGLLLDRSKKTHATLQAIRDLGFLIALDDFGTGFSSLRYLIDFRFDKLKIDRSFISGMATAESAKTIVKAVVDLGRALKLDVVAEGVETEAEALMVRYMGCQSMQGFYFSKPVRVAEFEALIDGFNRPAGSQSGIAVSLRVPNGGGLV